MYYDDDEDMAAAELAGPDSGFNDGWETDEDPDFSDQESPSNKE